MSIHCADDKACMEGKAYLESELISGSCAYLPRSAHDTFPAAAAAAFLAFRQLATEASALDDTTCSIIEKLIKAAAKRRSAVDADFSTRQQQQPWLGYKQQLQMRKQEEECVGRDEPRAQQHERWHEQQLLQERKLLALWSEGMSRPEDMSNQIVSHKDAQTPPPANDTIKREQMRGRECRFQEVVVPVVAAKEREIRQPTSFGVPIIVTEESAKTQEKIKFTSPFSTPRLPSVTPDFSARDSSTTVVKADHANSAERTQSTVNKTALVSAADESLIEIEKLLAALQELLNRLYNVALHAQERLDEFRNRLQSLLAQQMAGAPGTVSATAGDVSDPRGDEEEAVPAAFPTSASRAARVEMIEVHSATAEASSDLAKEERSASERRGGGRTQGARVCGKYIKRRDGNEEIQICESYSRLLIDEQAVLPGTDTTGELFYQQRKGQKQPESGRYKGGKRLHLKEWRQDRHSDYRMTQEEQQPSDEFAEQVSQPHSWSSAARHNCHQHLEPVLGQGAPPHSTLIPSHVITRKKQFLDEGSQKNQVGYQERMIVLLQLYQAIVRTIEGDWHFKQEVKGELRFESRFKLFLAARAAWRAKPFVSDLAPLLREAASLSE